MENQPPTICPNPGCGGKIIEKQGKKKDGTYYHFWGCSNFGITGCTFTWSPPKESGNPKPKLGSSPAPAETAMPDPKINAIHKMCQQLLYLLLGSMDPEDLKKALEEEFGQGVIDRVKKIEEKMKSL